MFSDSWVQALDDKENKLPSKRPVLTDPSKEFGESKVAKIDEVDGFIDASLDIPEINNEVLLSFIMPPTYCSVPTSSGNDGKPGKSLKKSSMHGKIVEFEKN